MKLKQVECDICGATEPTQEILMPEGLQCLCGKCWEWVLSKEGD